MSSTTERTLKTIEDLSSDVGMDCRGLKLKELYLAALVALTKEDSETLEDEATVNRCASAIISWGNHTNPGGGLSPRWEWSSREVHGFILDLAEGKKDTILFARQLAKPFLDKEPEFTYAEDPGLGIYLGILGMWNKLSYMGASEEEIPEKSEEHYQLVLEISKRFLVFGDSSKPSTESVFSTTRSLLYPQGSGTGRKNKELLNRVVDSWIFEKRYPDSQEEFNHKKVKRLMVDLLKHAEAIPINDSKIGYYNSPVEEVIRRCSHQQLRQGELGAWNIARKAFPGIFKP